MFFLYTICVLLQKLKLCQFGITKLAEICEELFKAQQASSNAIAALQGGAHLTVKTNGLIIESLKNVVEQVASKRVWAFMESKN